MELIGAYKQLEVYKRVITSGPACDNIQSVIKNTISGKCIHMEKIYLDKIGSCSTNYIIFGYYHSPKIYSCIYEALKDSGLNDEEIDNIITFLRF